MKSVGVRHGGTPVILARDVETEEQFRAILGYRPFFFIESTS